MSTLLSLPTSPRYESHLASDDGMAFECRNKITWFERPPKGGWLMQVWNNLSHEDLMSGFALKIRTRITETDYENPTVSRQVLRDVTIGYMEAALAIRLKWDSDLFKAKSRSICINAWDEPDGPDYVQRCNDAMIRLCEMNRNDPYLEHGMSKWIELRNKGKDHEYMPVLTPYRQLHDLKVPAPARGIFGIATAGVHMNAYTVDSKGIVNGIWVSTRSDNATFPRCFDQIAAGGMEPCDNLDPFGTFEREAREEASLDVASQAGVATMEKDGKKITLGMYERVGNIYFCTKKDRMAGKKEEGHIEPGVRFCYDLLVRPDVVLEPNKEDTNVGQFSYLSVEEVKESLRQSVQETRWKPNCGLVMLDFLDRKGLLTEEDRRVFGKVKELQKKFPLELPDFPWKVDGDARL